MAVQPTHKRLSNGLQSLSEASPDYELAPVGIASMHDQAQRLAEYGRNGDVYVIHAAEGETVIPMEVLDANPQIKQLLFAQMKDMGLDPQEFVVGNELNSINPVTGLPEFFFKSLFRSVKKAVKKVFKFAKKIAPIALPIAIGTFGLPFLGGTLGKVFGAGTAASAALGSGLGTLAGGGSLKDTFKSALLSGGIATLGGGLVRGFGATGDQGFGTEFMKGAGQTLTGTEAPIGELVEQGKKAVTDAFSINAPRDQTFDVGGRQFAGLGSGTTIDGRPITSYQAKAGPEIQLAQAKVQPKTRDDILFELIRQKNASTISPDMSRALQSVEGITPEILGQNLPIDSTGPFGTKIGGKLQRGLLGTKYTAADVMQAADIANLPPPITTADIAARNAIKKTAADIAQKASAGTIRTYAPLAAAGLGAGYYGGMFDPEEVEEPTTEDLQFGTDLSGPNPLFEADPDKFKIPVNPFQFQTASSPFVPTRFAADGGMIRGPGTGTSDSIPGWLSDGEFVLTERAVRGADPTGQGRREAGADNLYNIMRNFEMRA